MSASSQPATDADDGEDELVECVACNRTFRAADVHHQTWQAPESQIDADDPNAIWDEAWCEECVSDLAEEFGLAYRPPGKMPEPVETGGDDRGDA